MTDALRLIDHPLLATLGWTLTHFIWQGALLGLVTFFLLRGVRPREASTRYLIGVAGLAAMLIAPALTFVTAAGHTASARAAWQPAASGQPVAAGAVTGSMIANFEQNPAALRQWLPGRTSPPPQPEAAPIAPRWLPIVTAAWMAGVAVLSVRLVGGWALTLLLARRAVRRVSDEIEGAAREMARRLGVRRSFTVFESAAVQVPTLVGWLKPVVLVPASALMGLSAAQLQAVLAHELAHVRRHDYLVNILQSLVETLLFYHPAVWWVSAEVRAEREHCCDDLAVRVCGDRLLYVSALAELTSIERRAFALAATDGSLVTRVRRILGRPAAAERELPPSWSVLAVLVLLGGGAGTYEMSADADTIAQVAQAAAAVNGRAGSPAWVEPQEPQEPQEARAETSPPSAAQQAKRPAREIPPTPPAVPAPAPPTPAPSLPPVPPMPRAVAPVPPAEASVPAPAAVPPAPAAPTPPAPAPAPPVATPVPVPPRAVAPAAPSPEHPPVPAALPARPAVAAPTPPPPPPLLAGLPAAQKGSGNFTWNDNGKRLAVRWSGSFRLADDDRDIGWLEPGATLTMSDGWVFTDRVEMRGLAGGGIERKFYRSGVERAFDAEARAFLVEALQRMIRSGMFATERVARFLAAGGPDAVLAEVDRLKLDSSYVQRVYYSALLDQADLNATQLTRVLDRASTGITSDHEKATLFLKALEEPAVAVEQRALVVRAARGIASDFEQGRVLAAGLGREPVTPEMAAATLDAAETMASAHERGKVLRLLVQQGGVTPQTSARFMSAVTSMSSGHEQRQVLVALAALPVLAEGVAVDAVKAASAIDSAHERRQALNAYVSRGGASPRLAAATVASARDITSSHEKSQVLIALIAKGGVTDETQAEFFQTVRSLTSSNDTGVVLQALLAKGPLSTATLSGLLETAKEVSSSPQRASLLLSVLQTHSLSGRTRTLFVEAAEGISSSHEQNKVLAALVRAEHR